MGQFSLLWIDQMQRLGFNVDAVECEWGAGVDLDVLRSRLMADKARGTKLKAVCVVHNETATAVTNNLEKIRQVLGEDVCCVLDCGHSSHLDYFERKRIPRLSGRIGMPIL